MKMNQYSVNVINENLIRLGEYLALAQAALESKKGTDKALSGVCEVLAMAQGLANDALEEIPSLPNTLAAYQKVH